MTSSIDATELQALLSSNDAFTFLDVRKGPAFEADGSVIPGAIWRDPAAIDDWAAGIAGDKLVICYCVHGHEVTQGASATLREGGIDARYLVGGIDGWREGGGTVTAK